MKLTKLLKEFKSQGFFNGNMKIGQVYSNPYARSFVHEEGDEVERESGLNLEQKQAFLEAVKSYKKYSESIYRNRDLKEVYESIKNVVEIAQKMTIDETQDWFDGVTVSRHMKRMGESFKVFEKTLKEVSTLQQRLESAYDEIGEVLGKYYEINELEEGNEFGAARARAIAAGEDSFEVDGKTYKVTGVDKEDKENAKKFAGESVNEARMKEDDFMDRLEDYASEVIPSKDYIKKSTRDLLKQLIGSMRTDKKAKALYTYWSKNRGKDLLDKMGSIFESVNESTKLTDILKKKGESITETKKLDSFEKRMYNYATTVDEKTPLRQLKSLYKNAVDTNHGKNFEKLKDAMNALRLKNKSGKDKAKELMAMFRKDMYKILNTSENIESVNESTKLTDILDEAKKFTTKAITRKAMSRNAKQLGTIFNKTHGKVTIQVLKTQIDSGVIYVVTSAHEGDKPDEMFVQGLYDKNDALQFANKLFQSLKRHESVNEGQLNIGDTIKVKSGNSLQKLNTIDDKWKVIKKDNSTYTLQKVGSSMKVRHPQIKVDYLIVRPGQSQLPFIVESVNESTKLTDILKK
jgi:hypothetical protein